MTSLTNCFIVDFYNRCILSKKGIVDIVSGICGPINFQFKTTKSVLRVGVLGKKENKEKLNPLLGMSVAG